MKLIKPAHILSMNLRVCPKIIKIPISLLLKTILMKVISLKDMVHL